MARLTQAEIARIRKLHSNALKRAVLSSFTNIKNEAVLGDLVDRIDAGDIEGAIEVINLQAAKFAPMEAAMVAAYATAGERTADVIGKVQRTPLTRVVFDFDARAPRAEEWLRDKSSTLVQQIVTDQRDMIRTVLQNGMELGSNPRTTALDLVGRVDRVTKRRTGGIVGLTRHQYGYVQNMREDLENLDSRYFTRALRDQRFDGTIRKAIEEGKPLTAQQVRTITARYEDRLLNFRGETIGRTESLNALRAGQQESLLQALDAEGLQHRELAREWDASGDSRTRPLHRQMEGEKAYGNEPFSTPDGKLLRYPGDSSLGAPAEWTVSCRCVQRISVDFTGRALRMESF